MSLLPVLGQGLGLRPVHYGEVLASAPAVGFFEVISENFMVAGGNPRRVLREVRERYPVVLHGVSMSLGSTDALDEGYLDRLAALAAEVEPAWISDHLCWSRVGGHSAHDLWPLPYTEEAIGVVSERVTRVQERLGRRVLVENVSSYLGFAHSEMPEWEFLSEVATRADCGILLDLNNVYVSARNGGFDPARYLAGIPAHRVGQIHLAGHRDEGTHLLDSHDRPVCDDVWALYRTALAATGAVSTSIEWDDDIPPLQRLLAESRAAGEVEAAALAERAVRRAG